MGTQDGKRATAGVQGERAEETAKEEGQGRPAMGTAGQTPRSDPCSLAVASAPYLEPPCCSEPRCPPRRAGETTVSSPRPLWGQAFSAGSHPGRKPQGPPPSEGKIPWQRPTPAGRDPKSCVCAGQVEVLGQRTSRLEGLASTAGPPGGACSSCPGPTAASTRANTSGAGRVGLGEKVGLYNSKRKHWLEVLCREAGGSFPMRETLHLAHDMRHLLGGSLFAPFNTRKD